MLFSLSTQRCWTISSRDYFETRLDRETGVILRCFQGETFHLEQMRLFKNNLQSPG